MDVVLNSNKILTLIGPLASLFNVASKDAVTLPGYSRGSGVNDNLLMLPAAPLPQSFHEKLFA